MPAKVYLYGILCLFQNVLLAEAEPGFQKKLLFWTSPDRPAKVCALIPGAKIQNIDQANLFLEWTRQMVEKWQKANPGKNMEDLSKSYSLQNPRDNELVENFPRHISPFARVRSGIIAPDKAKMALAPWTGTLCGYCPFCGSEALSFLNDKENEYHIVTSCCKKNLYGREKDYPANYDLKSNTMVTFKHLDDTKMEIPCTIYKDENGVEWELFISTVFEHRRWLVAAEKVVSMMKKFKETADPLYVWKMAVILDKAADTYYGLPLSFYNSIAEEKKGEALTRHTWETMSDKECPIGVFKYGDLKPWNRRTPIYNKGWILMSKEDIWVEPFARIRHHPVFKACSLKLYGDPNALDNKIRRKLIGEIAMAFKSIFAQKLISNYQEANYVDMLLVGILAEDKTLIDFAKPNQELTLYNHHYYDGMNGEGSPAYMAMLDENYYKALTDSKGTWLEIYPDFLKGNPFFHTASSEWRKLHTVRGLSLEFNDQHIYAFDKRFITDTELVKQQEAAPSMNWPGWGLGILRTGSTGHRQEISVAYTRASLHTSSDPLGISYWFDGVPIIRPGGYAHHPIIKFTPSEKKELNGMGYPHEIFELEQPQTWDFVHSPVMQNTVTVNEKFPSIGWEGNRGYGELVTFKGGESAGSLGSHFQILDVANRYSYEKIGIEVSKFRRAVMAVEAADGKPYAIDIFTVNGGNSHTLYTNVWGQRNANELFSQSQFASMADYLKLKMPELSKDKLNAISSELTIGGKKFIAMPVEFKNNQFDFSKILNNKLTVGESVYLFTELECVNEQSITIGAGADWWMKWWLNGECIYDNTTANGNISHPPKYTDHIIRANLKKGKNIIVVKVISGSGGFLLLAAVLDKFTARADGISKSSSIVLPEKWYMFGPEHPCNVLEDRVCGWIRNVSESDDFQKKMLWSRTWKTDYALYVPRSPQEKTFIRPFPDSVGKTNLRIIGIPQADNNTKLFDAKNPWLAVIRQPLMNGNMLYTNVGFRDALDCMIERRITDGQNLSSIFTHIFEGYRENEVSSIKKVSSLVPSNMADKASIVCLKIEFFSGYTDIVIYNPKRVKLEFENGISTDACYSLFRQDAENEVEEIHIIRGSFFKYADIELKGASEFTGEIVDIIGDITGIRFQSTFIIKPDIAFPSQIPIGCRQMIIEGPNQLRYPIREAYEIEKIRLLHGGLCAVDITKNAPFINGWHQVKLFDPVKKNIIKTDRPMIAGCNSPWYYGTKIWFPERNVSATIKSLDASSGSAGAWTLELDENIDLQAQGIKIGDWYVVYSIMPGMKVIVPNVITWKKKWRDN